MASETRPTTPDHEKQLLEFSPDDEGNAQSVMLLYGDEILYTDAYGDMVYTGTHWETKLATPKINRAIIETFKARGKIAFANATQDDPKKALIAASRLTANNRNSTKAMLLDLITVNEACFDNDPDLLNCANGVLHLPTGKLTPHDPSQRFTYCLPVEYDPDAKSPLWDNFLSHSLARGGVVDPTYLEYLQMSVGYSLTGHTREEVLFYLEGPTRSGKGTFTSVLLAMMGKPLAMGVDFQTFTAQRNGDTQNFDLAGMKACRFVSASESGRYQMLNAPKIKQLTGNDPIRAAFKGKDSFTYVPQFKIWLTSNFSIRLDPEDDAAWARVQVFRFPNSYLGQENKKLKVQLQKPNVLKAVLAWAVEGAKKWYAADRGLVMPDQVRRDVEAGRAAIDYVQQFLDEHYTLVSDEGETDKLKAWLPSSQVYSNYAAWCESEGFPKKNQGQFVSALKSKGFRAGRKWYGGQQVRCVIGVREL